ncbi:MAG: hypothetical protein FWG88_01270, partial [Oscillospiraceae bacterium]|nr:hypothetical protein [Oscillospiraceae bacterium]
MKTASRKTLSAVLVLAMVFAMFAAMTITASAANASELAGQINSFPHGGTGTLTATASGNTVTVTGNVTGVTERLDLRIDPDVTVIWKAEFTGSPPTYLIHLTGAGMYGTFEVAQGAYLETDNIA